MGRSPESGFIMPPQESHEQASESGVLVVIAGPTASGKSDIQKGLVELNPGMHRVATYTTRERRSIEREGIDYHFIDRATFEEGIAAGEFLESDEYNGQLYGTKSRDLLPLINGQDVTWIVTMPRAVTLDDFFRQKFDPAIAQQFIDQKVTMLVNAPTWEDLAERFIHSRGGTKEEFAARIAPDRKFYEENKGRFDATIVNPDGKLIYAINEAQLEVQKKREQLKAKSSA